MTTSGWPLRCACALPPAFPKSLQDGQTPCSCAPGQPLPSPSTQVAQLPALPPSALPAARCLAGRWCGWRRIRPSLRLGRSAARWWASGALPLWASPSPCPASTSTSSRVRRIGPSQADGGQLPDFVRSCCRVGPCFGLAFCWVCCPLGRPICLPANSPPPADDKKRGGHVLDSELLEGEAWVQARLPACLLLSAACPLPLPQPLLGVLML